MKRWMTSLALGAAATAALAVLPATPAQATTASLADNGDGTVTVTYSGGAVVVSFCAVGAGSCNAGGSAQYTIGYGPTALPSSPFTIATGTTAGSRTNMGSMPGTYSASTLPAGTYQIVLFDTVGVSDIASLSSASIGSGGGSGGGASAAAPTETLTLAVNAGESGASCTGGNPSGVAGAWLTLPAADQCTQSGPTAKAGATLLGWSTSANFPIARAQAQIDKKWGVIDEDIEGVRMIFIPGGMATFVSGSNNLYPIWSK